jgi:hypothetical protein
MARPLQAVDHAEPRQSREHQQPLQISERHAQLWLSTRDLLTHELYAPSMRAAYSWLHRHGIVRRGDGKVSVLDVRRALKRQSRRGRSVNSLANLRKAR